MRNGLSRTIAVAATAAIAASGTAAMAGGGGDSHDRGSYGGKYRGADYATVKYPSGRTLVLFDRRHRKDVAIKGLARDERVVGIDVRPATDDLYGVSSANRVFTIDPYSGRIGNPQALTDALGATVSLSGAFFGVDFNPSVDRLRIVSDSDQNLRVNVDTGLAAVDTPLQYPAGDRNAGQDPAVAAVGYTFADLGGPTALYDVDSARDTFALQNPPNAGTLNSIGPVGLDVGAQGGFDIAGKDRFHAFGFYQQGGVARLYQHRFDQNGRARYAGITLRGKFDGFAVLDAYGSGH